MRLLEGDAVNVIDERQSIQSAGDERKRRTNARLNVIMNKTGDE